MRYSLFFVLALGACKPTSSPEAEALVSSMQVQWRHLDDGSQFAITHLSEGDLSASERCWPDGKTGFTCLYVSESRNPYHTLTVEHTAERQLPTALFPAGAGTNGYRCTSVLDMQEEIDRDGANLDTNIVRRSGERWSAAHVARYMADNHVNGTGYFLCLEVLMAIRRGSLETLGTTSVSRKLGAVVLPLV